MESPILLPEKPSINPFSNWERVSILLATNLLFSSRIMSAYTILFSELASFCISLTIDSIDSTEKLGFSIFSFSLQEKRNNVLHRTIPIINLKIVFIFIQFEFNASTFFQEYQDLQNATKEKRISLSSLAMDKIFFLFHFFSQAENIFSGMVRLEG